MTYMETTALDYAVHGLQIRERLLIVTDPDALGVLYVDEDGHAPELHLVKAADVESRASVLAHVHRLMTDDWYRERWCPYLHWRPAISESTLDDFGVALVFSRSNAGDQWPADTRRGEMFWRQTQTLLCGAPTTKGSPCRRVTSSWDGRAYCHQHRARAAVNV